MPSIDEARQDLDLPRLRGLLDLAGQDLAAELSRLLIADLAGVSARLVALQGAEDPATVRAQSHVLLALSGTIGAHRLADAAGRLNAIARSSETAGLAPAMSETVTLLNALIPELDLALKRMLAAP